MGLPVSATDVSTATQHPTPALKGLEQPPQHSTQYISTTSISGKIKEKRAYMYRVFFT